MLTAILAKPNGRGGAIIEVVDGRTLREIEEKADVFGAMRVELMTGEIWRKLFGEWIII